MNLNIYAVPNIRERLVGNPYVGRGIVVGKSVCGKYAVCAYFIMGRSANSRNRVFVEREGDIYTEPYDASKVSDPSLIIYRALCHFGKDIILTNGDQTDTVYQGMLMGKSFSESLLSREFEPDAPNLTPRISGMLHLGEDFTYEMSILKSADREGTACNRYTFQYPALSGLGHFIHTYVTDGNPIPTFQGEPERVAIPSDIDAFTEEIWTSLNEENKISLYVLYTNLENGESTSRLINKNA